LTTAEVARLRAKHGENTLPSNEVAGWYIFVQQLWQPMPILIWIAIIIEAAIQSFPDMVRILLHLYLLQSMRPLNFVCFVSCRAF
jgi:H+-transporting ATPase